LIYPYSIKKEVTMITVEVAKQAIIELFPATEGTLPSIKILNQERLENILWELIKSHRLLECPNCQCSLEGYFKE